MSELDKLEAYLKEHGYEYTRKDVDEDPYMDVHQIAVYENGQRLWDAICHIGSYGYEEGLLEIMGNIVWDNIDGDIVRGWLTANDVIARIERGAEGAIDDRKCDTCEICQRDLSCERCNK